MNDRIIKLLGTETSLTTETNFNSAQLIRVFNDNASAALITVIDNGTTTGTVTVKAGETIFIRKRANETISSSVSVKIVSIGFGD